MIEKMKKYGQISGLIFCTLYLYLYPVTPEPWNHGTLEPWNPGTLEPWLRKYKNV